MTRAILAALCAVLLMGASTNNHDGSWEPPAGASEADKALMQAWFSSNELCRGTYDEERATIDCQRRDRAERELELSGWCWDYSDRPASDSAWHRCGEAFPTANPTPRVAVGFWVTVLLIGTFLYFVPTFVAVARKHPNDGAIVVLNVLLGWSFIGWVIALVWALTNQTPQTIIVHAPRDD